MSDRCPTCNRPYPGPTQRCVCCGGAFRRHIGGLCPTCIAEGYVVETLDLREVTNAAEAEHAGDTPA